MRRDWAKVERLASRQFGTVSREQLFELEFDRHQIDNALKHRVLIAVVPGAYAFFGAQLTWESRAMAATLIGGEESALSHHSAASVYGLDGAGISLSIHLSLPVNRSARFGKSVMIHRSIQPFTIVKVKGLQVTTLARTAFDLSKTLPPASLEALLDSAHLKSKTFAEELRTSCQRLERRYHGARLINQMLKERIGSKTESWLEQQVSRKMRAFGVPEWAEQVRVHDAEGFISRVDFTWPKERLVLHADSYRWHSSRARFDLDAEQRSRLEAQGWAAQIVTTTTLKSDEWLGRLVGLLSIRAKRQMTFPLPDGRGRR